MNHRVQEVVAQAVQLPFAVNGACLVDEAEYQEDCPYGRCRQHPVYLFQQRAGLEAASDEDAFSVQGVDAELQAVRGAEETACRHGLDVRQQLPSGRGGDRECRFVQPFAQEGFQCLRGGKPAFACHVACGQGTPVVVGDGSRQVERVGLQRQACVPPHDAVFNVRAGHRSVGVQQLMGFGGKEVDHEAFVGRNLHLLPEEVAAALSYQPFLFVDRLLQRVPALQAEADCLRYQNGQRGDYGDEVYPRD